LTPSPISLSLSLARRQLRAGLTTDAGDAESGCVVVLSSERTVAVGIGVK
jgi:hypothetical protein